MGNRVAPTAEQGARKASGRTHFRRLDTTPTFDETTLTERVFHSMLTLERGRAERSRKPFVLMLLDAHQENGAATGLLRRAVDVTLACNRETDLVGWYKEGAILGVIFTEVNVEGKQQITEILRTKIEMALVKHLGRERAAKIHISLHVFPEAWNNGQLNLVVDSKPYSDPTKKPWKKRLPLVIKRVTDIAIRVTERFALQPMRTAIATIAKRTSKILDRPARGTTAEGRASSGSVRA